MLPITIAVIGAKNTKNAFQSFTLSVVYTLGIALTYAILGVFAAITGSLFGSLLQNIYVVGTISIIFLLMGLSMFDVFYVQVPSSIQTKLAKVYQKQGAKNNYASVAFMGLLSGLIATPCVGPVIVSMLTFVAQTKSIFLGFWLLFTFAIGMGIILVVIGTFSNSLVNLPKAGNWMNTIKNIMGLAMIFMAFYYIRPILSEYIFTIIAGISLVIMGVFSGASLSLHSESSSFQKLQKSLGIIVISTGLYLFIGAMASKGLFLPSNVNMISDQTKKAEILEKKDKTELKWLSSLEEGITIAKSENKYIMIDFYADWCPACIELDKYTYTDQKVIEELNDFIAVKIDATKITPEIEKMFQKYGIVGLPAVIFMDKQGNFLQDFTLSGFEKPEIFIKRIKSIKSLSEQQA